MSEYLGDAIIAVKYCNFIEGGGASMSSVKKTDEKPQDYAYGSDKLKLVFAGIILIIGILCELYVMINDHSNITLLAVFALVILFAAYISMTTIISRREYSRRQAREEYDNLIKSEKASYLLMRKYFSELEERIAGLEENINASAQEISSAQKTAAKLIINKERESMGRLFTDNEKQINKLEELHNRQNEQAERFLQYRQDIIKEVSDTGSMVKDSLMQMGHISYAQPQMVMPQSVPESVIPATEPQTVLRPEIKTEVQSETISEEIPASAFATDKSSVPEALAKNIASEIETIPDDVVGKIAADAVTDVMVDSMPLSWPSDDPNHMMTPDEIAALVAGTAQPEPPVAEAAESVAPEIDLSDPNHIMSPDEIAALLASM